MSKDHEIIYGLHATKHALQQTPTDIVSIWIQHGKKSHKQIADIIFLSEKFSIHVEHLPKSTLDKHCGNAVHQGVIMTRKTPHTKQSEGLTSILSTTSAENGLFLVLDGIQDPHNLGACLRTADAASVNAIIITRDRAAGITPTVRKVSSGASEHTPVIAVTNLSQTLRNMKEAGVWIIGMDNNANQTIYNMDLTIPLALVLGAEEKGLRVNTRNQCDFLAHLPMHGVVESLNVSVASGISLFEVNRQRGKIRN